MRDALKISLSVWFYQVNPKRKSGRKNTAEKSFPQPHARFTEWLMRNMEFNSNAAMQEYVSDLSQSYKSIADKYKVPLSRVKKIAKEEQWVKKRNEKKESDSQTGKLSLLKKTSDRAISALFNTLSDYELLSINDLKNISSILKTLTAVQRDLNDLPTYKEENTIRISNERLSLVRAKSLTPTEFRAYSALI